MRPPPQRRSVHRRRPPTNFDNAGPTASPVARQDLDAQERCHDAARSERSDGGITSKFSVSRAEQATPEISFTYNHLTVGSGDKVSVTKWIEYYFAGISQDACTHLQDCERAQLAQKTETTIRGKSSRLITPLPSSKRSIKVRSG